MSLAIAIACLCFSLLNSGGVDLVSCSHHCHQRRQSCCSRLKAQGEASILISGF
ncbi:hypothetical protein ACJW30_05G102700 [Castanea mollissima]